MAALLKLFTEKYLLLENMSQMIFITFNGFMVNKYFIIDYKLYSNLKRKLITMIMTNSENVIKLLQT